ncbi:hypothetical protein ACCO45_009786 [Purpureocillium lilacinum]|uniref:Uncharacterized protein n=1 Tax=Purpureocillium lilacinum TaxID=33203 RepID=A0ACC4DKQ6_PURLI
MSLAAIPKQCSAVGPRHVSKRTAQRPCLVRICKRSGLAPRVQALSGLPDLSRVVGGCHQQPPSAAVGIGMPSVDDSVTLRRRAWLRGKAGKCREAMQCAMLYRSPCQPVGG